MSTRPSSAPPSRPASPGPGSPRPASARSSPSDRATPRFAPQDFAPTAEQREIQTSSARHVIAMANAGAAKTTTLALRIAESITRGVAPEQILALSFSAEAARVLQGRLLAIGLDAQLARRVRCTTFDDFARATLRDIEGGDTPYLDTFEAVAPHVRAAVAELHRLNALRRAPRELWLPEHNAQIADFLKITQRLKTQLVRPDLDEDETVALRADALDIPEAIFALYRQLEKARAGDGEACLWRTRFDPTYDLACLLTAPDAEPPALPRYRVLIVDELQDMNPASYACLEQLLAQGGAFFTGAGDFDQVIHGWAGADVGFIRSHFGAGWHGVARLTLTTTFRHGPAMALATAALKAKAVVSGRGHAARLRIERYADTADAARRTLDCVRDWRARGGRLDECAIILRSPDQSIAIENALLEAGIGVRVEGFDSYLLRPEILMLRGVIAFALADYESIPGAAKRLQVLQALELWQELSWSTSRIEDLKTAAAQPELFDAFLHGRLLRPQTQADQAATGLSEDEETAAAQRLLALLGRLRREGRHDEANALLARQQAAAQAVADTPAQQRARQRLQQALAILREAPADEPAALALGRAAQALDLEKVAQRIFIDPADAATVGRSIAGFIDAARALGKPLRAFAQWLREAEEKVAELRRRKTVLLCTVEAAKGQEFAAVILPFLEEGAFPLAGCDRSEEHNRFYVAATRMRDELSLLVPADAARQSPFVTAMKIDAALARGQLQLDALSAGEAHD
ncbi:ATP-dependent helicase [Thauera sp.]|uniref:ATP-dependent helicase n=1 Tax=Thauera sp. TaxID=1905334 RepID=UPI002CA6F133|nr:ATP-dependent helicase [Thauera sp.]HRP26483.1 ATP-dependent helicase [Thauera sp.]